jgi:peroxiredoxin
VVAQEDQDDDLFLQVAQRDRGVLALVASPAFAGKYNSAINVGEKAPSFEGIPAVKGTEDTSLSLADIKEDVVVLVFLANHCPVVTAYEDRIIDFANDYKDKNVKVVGICVTAPGTPQFSSDNLDAIKARIKDKGYNYVYGYDETGKIGKAYGAVVTPQFFVLDKDRVIRYTGASDDHNNEARASKQYLRDAVDAVLAGETVEESETRAFGCGVKYAAQ